MTFSYVARDAAGQDRRGTLDAAAEATALAELRSRGLLVVELRPGTLPGRDASRRPAREGWLPPRRIHVEVSLRQLSLMLRSGLPLLAALRTCAEQSPRATLRSAYRRVAERIQEGWTLSDAMAEHRFFPPIVVTMVRVGEETGVLDRVLVQGAQALERRRHLATSLRNALSYPAVVVVMAVAVVAYMMIGLIPKLRVFLSGFGRRLPPMTQTLVDVSTFLQEHAVHIVVGLVVAAVAVWAVYAWPPARLRIDRAALRVPVVGSLLRLAATASFARSLSALLASGVRLTEALRVTEGVHRNRHVAERVAAARERVLQGTALAEPLRECSAFEPMLAGMVAVGESSGTLDEVLGDVAEFHEGRLQERIRTLSSLLEPVVLVVVGGLVGFIYVSVFMAIYAIAGNR